METPVALSIVGALRVCFGLVLLRAAAISRVPVGFRVLGVFLMIVGVMTPFFGVERSRAVLEWWATDGFAFLRPAVGLAVPFGLFLAFAVVPRGRPARRSSATR